MTVFFTDTSAIAKRYMIESGSAWVNSLVQPIAGNIIVVADLTPVEMFSLLARKQRENVLTTNDLQQIQSTFMLHVEKEYLTISLDNAVLVQARMLVNKHPLRALDAIQLACALRATAILNEPMTFISADNNLLNAASAEGFITDNPNAHP